MKSAIAILLCGLVAALCVKADELSPNSSANAEAATKPSAEASPAKTSLPVSCLTDTGSRIKRKSSQCLNVTGRRYDRDDVNSTGQTNVGDALRQLDPRIGNGVR